MQIWLQQYDPLNNIWLSSLVAACPMLFYFFALTGLRLNVNTAPVASCTMGIPVIVTAKVTGPDSFAIGQLPFITLKHSLIFTCIVRAITALQASVFSWMIP